METENQKSGSYLLWQSPDGLITGRIARLTRYEVKISDVWKLIPNKWNLVRIADFKTYKREDLLLVSSVY